MWLARNVVLLLKRNHLKIAFAESCTGGLLASLITAVPGSSDVFDIGVVTYANSAKKSLLSVSNDTLDLYGAVSSQTAQEMVVGLKKLSNADICVSVTGIAGPGGGNTDKPVGLVYIGFNFLNIIHIERIVFTGTRKNIRKNTTKYILEKITLFLEEN